MRRGLEEDLEGDFLNDKMLYIIPAGYQGDSNESVSFPNHNIV